MDPKLKEAYDRVMATPVPPPLTTPKPANPQPTVVSPTAVASQEPMQATTPIASTTLSATPANTPTQSKQTVGFAVAMPKHSSSGLKMLPVLIGIGGVIFFIVYAVFWIKFFNVKIPFLPF